MIARIWRRAPRAIRRALLGRRDERGYAAMLVAVMAPVIFIPLSAFAVDIARWYVEVQRVQNAADAAATAGVTYMPDDFATATTTAVAVSGRNGYPNSGTSRVAVARGAKPSELQVTVTSTIPNTFGAFFGDKHTTISRSALADYVGPALMGSPCNTFGNEPPGAGQSPPNDPVRGPTGSQIVAPSGGAQCVTNPQLWAAVAGPDTPKGNGDEYMTRSCTSGTDGCSGSANAEFHPEGYFYLVRIGAGAVGQPVTVQIYDPAWVSTGDHCDSAPSVTSGYAFSTATSSPTSGSNWMNQYATQDAKDRYAETSGTYCTGDVDNTSSGTDYTITTSYAMRAPVDTYVPDQGAPVTTSTGAQCAKQYPGYLASAVTTKTLTQNVKNSKADPTGSSNGSFNSAIAQVFHQWVNLCTFTPATAGDYYLQVRTNVALGGSSDGQGGYSGNSAVYTQTGDNRNVHGDGNNRFAVRVTGAARGSVSITGWNNMSIYANYPANSSTVFNLVRVPPAAASKTLEIDFFDVGDANSSGTVTILPPTDSNMTGALPGCVGSGVANGTLGSCTLSNVSSSTYNGKIQRIYVPIPASYTCQYQQSGGCWFRVQTSFPGGLQDTTTWSASVTGDPVRLVQ